MAWIFTLQFGLVAALLTAAVGYWLWNKRARAISTYKAFNVEQWKPRAIRPLTKAELLALGHLQQAIPECLVLPQISLSRFIKVRQTKSYGQWFGRVGRRCVDFLVCSPAGDVLGAVELLRANQTASLEASSVGGQRKNDTLQLASVPLWQLNLEQLAVPSKIRLLVMPELEAAEAAKRTRGFAHTDLQPRGAGIEAVELDDSRWSQAWPNEDSRPSELLDENDSGSAPLHPANSYGR